MLPRIVSPIDRPEEAAPLLDAGADELYGGYLPQRWRNRYGLLGSINQRTFAAAQLESVEALSTVAAAAHERGKRFALTLNAPFYSDAQRPMLAQTVDEAVEAGIDSVILADLGLLRLLRRRHPALEFHASTLAHLTNSAAVEFYRRQGCSRAVLPRHLTVAEMAEVTRKVPGMRFDAFLLVGKCPNTEGLCTFHHSSPDRIWPCEIPYRITAENEPASAALAAAMERQASWSGTNRRHGCGLCAIPALAAAGIFGLKLVGRGAPSAMKVSNVKLARDFLRLAGECSDPADYRRRALKAHRRRFGTSCSPNVCYYPEFYQAE